jgi:hypothetical protein
MLLNDIDKVNKLMEDTNKQGEIITKYNRLQKIYNDIQENEKYILLPLISLSNLNDYLSDIDISEIRNQMFYIIDMLNKLNKDIDKIDDVKLTDINIIKDNAINLDGKIKINWQDYMKEKNEDILDSLILLEKLVDKVQILQLKTAINKISKDWPVTKDFLNKYNDAIHESTQLINGLNVTDNVREFLLLVTKGEATLEDIDENIFDWLKKHNLIEKMKIQPI